MSKTITMSVTLEMDVATIQKIASRGCIDSATGDHIGLGTVVDKCRRYADHRTNVISRIDNKLDFVYELGRGNKIHTYLFYKGRGKGPAIKVLCDRGTWYYTIDSRVHYDQVIEKFSGTDWSTPYKSQWCAIGVANDVLMGKLDASI